VKSKEVFTRLDINRDGWITWDEFQNGYQYMAEVGQRGSGKLLRKAHR
jgi:Ca2+-binding EF-hand superfamily protein